MRKLISLFLLFTSISIGAQNDTTKNIYEEDFNTFIQLLEETHPDPYTAFGGRIEFGRNVQDTRAKVQTSANDNEFRNYLSRFISRLEDGHTIIDNPRSVENNKVSKFFPIVFKIASDGLFIDYTSSEYDSYVGNKLLSINGIEIDTLLKKINTIAPAENKYGTMLNLRNKIANQQSANTFLENTSNVTLSLRDKQGNSHEISVVYSENPNWQKPTSRIKIGGDNKLLFGHILENNSKVGYFAWNATVSREVLESIPPSNPQYQRTLNYIFSLLEIDKPADDKQAIQQIPKLYSRFHVLLEQMKELKSEYLIIGLRKNTGGMTPLTLPLLYMLYGDKYLNYKSEAQYIQRISPLLLKKWGITTADLLEKNRLQIRRL